MSAFEKAEKLSPIVRDGEVVGGVLGIRTSPIRVGSGEVVKALAERLKAAAEGDEEK